MSAKRQKNVISSQPIYRDNEVLELFVLELARFNCINMMSIAYGEDFDHRSPTGRSLHNLVNTDQIGDQWSTLFASDCILHKIG